MTEYQCPFCDSWIPKESFRTHQISHEESGALFIPGSYSRIKLVESIEELKRRFEPLGMYQER